MAVIGARAHDFDFHTPASLFEAVSAAGYRAVQLACPKSFSWAYPLTDEQIADILTASQKYHVEIGVLGCYQDLACRDREKRMAAVDTYIKGLVTGKALNVRCVGSETTHFEGSREEQKAAFSLLLDSVLRMAEAAEKTGVDMGIEPVFQNTLGTPELAAELKEKVGSRRLKWIWDAVNVLDPSKNEEDCLLQKHTVDLLGKDIVAMHIKGVRFRQTGKKEACPLADGEFDWRFPFRWAREQQNMLLLREEAIPSRSKEEIAIMEALLILSSK